MKKIKTGFILISLLLLPVVSCTQTDPNLKPLPGSSRIPTPTPVPTTLVSQQDGAWTTEDNVSKLTLTITKRIDNVYDFVGTAQPKSGGSPYVTSGNIKYEEKEAVFMFNKPGSAMVRSTYEITDNGNTFTYTITASDTETLKQGNKYIYKRSN